MTKTLTEQYKFGEIKTGYYWCKIWGEDDLAIKWLVEDNEIHQPNLIEEVLAPVPTYAEFMDLMSNIEYIDKYRELVSKTEHLYGFDFEATPTFYNREGYKTKHDYNKEQEIVSEYERAGLLTINKGEENAKR